MSLQSLLKLNTSISARILPQNFGEDQKKGLYCILLQSQSKISDFSLPSGYYFPEN